MPATPAPTVDGVALQKALAAYCQQQSDADPLRFGTYWSKGRDTAADPKGLVATASLLRDCVEITGGVLRMKTKQVISVMKEVLAKEDKGRLNKDKLDSEFYCTKAAVAFLKLLAHARRLAQDTKKAKRAAQKLPHADRPVLQKLLENIMLAMQKAGTGKDSHGGDDLDESDNERIPEEDQQDDLSQDRQIKSQGKTCCPEAQPATSNTSTSPPKKGCL